MKNQQIVLAKRPFGWVKDTDFRRVESDLPVPGAGEVLVKNAYLSLDPYMRQRMNDAKSYAQKVELGDVMVGSTVGEVIESNDASFQPGTIVTGSLGWQNYAVAKVEQLRQVPSAFPLTASLGVLGMPGATAWYGLNEIGAPKAGETVVVSAAAGAVGSIVGQLAKLKGCRVVGIAGGAAKCKFVVDELGFDACVDYKSAGFFNALRNAAPAGIDIYFESVGGAVFETVLGMLNPFARIPLCGLISQYNKAEPYELERLYAVFLYNRIRFQGFIASDHIARWPEAFAELSVLLAEGKLKSPETVSQGIESAPAAFISMLKGGNTGKQLVRL